MFLGAYGFVFVAQDVSSGKEYALKVNIWKDRKLIGLTNLIIHCLIL